MPETAGFQIGDLKSSQDPYAILEAARAKSGAVFDAGGSWFIFGHAKNEQAYLTVYIFSQTAILESLLMFR